MKLRKTQLAAAVGAALLAGAVQAQNVQPGQPGMNVQLYGHVNRAMMFADNDLNSKWFFVDGQPSSTRFGIFAEADVQPGLRAGARIETEIRSNRSNEVTFVVPSTGSQSFTERFMEVFVRGGWGQVNLGQGAGASDSTMEVDFAGVDLALSNPMNDFGGAIPFTRTVGSTTTASTVTPDTVMNNLDGFSRLDRVMYTTPTFNGFRAQVSYGNTAGSGAAIAAGEAFEAGIFWQGKVAGDLGFAFGYAKSSPNTAGLEATEHMGGSVSWLHTSGFSIGAAWGERDLSTATNAPTLARTAEHMNVQLGYKWGQHALGVKYESTNDLAAIGDEATGYGFGYVWNPIRWAEFYASYMIFSFDRTPVGAAAQTFNDVTVAALGTRIRF